MLLSNIEEIPGKKIIAFHGVVSGSTVRAKHVGRDIMASLKNIVRGELKKMLKRTREKSVKTVD